LLLERSLPVDHVADEPLESFVHDELLVNVSVIFQERLHNIVQGLILRHSRRTRRILLGILVRSVGCDFRRDVITDTLHRAIRIVEQGAKLLIERFEAALEKRVAAMEAQLQRLANDAMAAAN
jgi:hypothetical protein